MWTTLAEALQSSLHPSAPPIAITFSDAPPAGVDPFDAPMPPPTHIATLLDAGWITEDMIPGIPVVRDRPGAITFGPLADTPVDPDVILLRLTAKSLMVLSDALPGLRVEGKPQCHIVAAAKEQGEVVASVGCMLSRTRTGMSSGEVTCAIPAGRLGEVVERLESTARADAAVASYAAEDARRFS